MASRVGLELPHAAGGDGDDDDFGPGQRGPGRVGDDALQARADGLRGGHTSAEGGGGGDSQNVTNRSLDHDRSPSGQEEHLPVAERAPAGCESG